MATFHLGGWTARGHPHSHGYAYEYVHAHGTFHLGGGRRGAEPFDGTRRSVKVSGSVREEAAV